MIEKKVLNKRSIKKLIRDNYGIEIDEVKTVSGGSAEIYLLENDTKYILKLYQSKYKLEDVLKEITVINYLKDKNYLVPKYYETLNHEYCVVYKDRVMILQEYIAGATKEKFEASISEIKECGYLHGLLVRNLMDYETSTIQEIDEYFDFENSIKKLNKVINMGDNKIVISDMKKKIEILEKIKLDLSNIDKVSYYVSHGDFSYLQFIYDEGKCKAIIDFIRVKKLPIVWEIMRSYSYMDKKCEDSEIDIDNLILYVKEFMREVPLNKYDLEYMPYIYLCQLLASTYGYKEVYTNDNLEVLKFAQFRTKLCLYLYKHVDEISKRLGEIL